MWDWFVKGGPVMWPLLLCSIVAVAVVLERLYHWWRMPEEAEALLVEVQAALQRGNLPAAQEACTRYGGPVAAVLKALLEGQAQGSAALEELAAAAEAQEVSRLERNLDTLTFITNVSPLLGLLGTVTGMIKTFNVFALHGVNAPGPLAAGIAEALITTEAGLMIAIPAMAAHHFLMKKVDLKLLEMEKASAAVLAILRPETEEGRGGAVYAAQ